MVLILLFIRIVLISVIIILKLPLNNGLELQNITVPRMQRIGQILNISKNIGMIYQLRIVILLELLLKLLKFIEEMMMLIQNGLNTTVDALILYLVILILSFVIFLLKIWQDMNVKNLEKILLEKYIVLYGKFNLDYASCYSVVDC